MPLFLIPIGLGVAALSSAIWGGTKGYRGISSMRSAKAIGEAAEASHARHVRQLDAARDHLRERLSALDRLRKTINATTFAALFRFLEKINQSARVRAFRGLGDVGITTQQLERFARQYLEAGGSLSGALKAAITGKAVGATTTAIATNVGVASTGAAISGLSGAAANSALLAFLGGGSLAVGGGGMALGTLVLGGVTIGPAIAVGGWVLAREGEKALTKAVAFEAKVARAIGEIETLVEVCRRAEKRIEELSRIIRALNRRTVVRVQKLSRLGRRFAPDDDAHVELFAITMQLAKALRDVMQAQVFTKEGDISAELERLLERQRRLLKEVDDGGSEEGPDDSRRKGGQNAGRRVQRGRRRKATSDGRSQGRSRRRPNDR